MPEKRTTLPRLMMVSSGNEHLHSNPGVALSQTGVLGRSAPVIFQLREKGIDTGTLYRLSCLIAPAIEASGSILCINERFDIALASGAAGVHLPESSAPPDVVRKTAPSLITGRSVHSLASALADAEAGLDYLLFGPVFHTPSKEPFGPPQGLVKLREVCRSVSIPVFAVGGITPERSPACIEQGAYGVAALAPFLDLPKLPDTINRFQSTLPA
ncbi:MAG: thiamine phosphate synthase [Chlorobiaceae bacterium]|nr:thiamine phosphate synthase [Chlorobiaceae bacterium]